MKKKILISLTLICLILVGLVLMYRNNKKTNDVQNNQVALENEIQYNNKEENIVENTTIEETFEILEKNKNENVEAVENKTEKKDTQKVNDTNKSTTNKPIQKENTTTEKPKSSVSNNEKTISKSEETKENITTEKPKEEIVKEKEETTTDKTTNKQITDNKKTEEIKETPKCNHSDETYYNTEEEAIAFYKKTSKEYGNKVKNGEITYEEYLKLCPYGYETMSCPICERWTISFYYE